MGGAAEQDEVGATGAAPFAPAAGFVSADPTQHRFRCSELRWPPTRWGGVALVRAWGGYRLAEAR